MAKNKQKAGIYPKNFKKKNPRYHKSWDEEKNRRRKLRGVKINSNQQN